MKITITPNREPGATAIPRPRVLGDDSIRDFITLVPPIEGSVQVQTVALPRASKTERFRRYNAEVRFTFVVDRAHLNFAAALAFAIQEVKQVKGIIGTLSLSGSGITGGGEETISDCVISAVRVLSLNSSTVIQYSVEGGDFD